MSLFARTPPGKHHLPVRCSPEIEDALHSGRPVVALESNVISHGLPQPQNLESAHAVEKAVRIGGAIPATTAVIGGEVVIGLSESELELMSATDRAKKVSNRSLAECLVSGDIGATTIAATIAIADTVGIPTVASAGLGGVHRDVAQTLDISADLGQLVRSRVMVVCAGAKSILDLPKTLEYLETQGVPVIGFRSDDFPAFYVASSGLRCPSRLDDPGVISRTAQLHWSLPGSGCLVITHPIDENKALDREAVETAIKQALRDAEAQSITGASITKFLMRAIDRSTEGRSSEANAAVLASTAGVAAEIAVAWSEMHMAAAR